MGRGGGVSRPSPAIVVAVLALVAALAGTAIAASESPVDNAASAKKKAKQALKLAKANREAIENIELTPGPPGERGPQGPPGLTGLEMVFVPLGTNTSTSPKFSTATCPAGKVAISGAYTIEGGTTGMPPSEISEIVVTTVAPSPETQVPGFVFVAARESTATSVNWSVRAIALCANAP